MRLLLNELFVLFCFGERCHRELYLRECGGVRIKQALLNNRVLISASSWRSWWTLSLLANSHDTWMTGLQRIQPSTRTRKCYWNRSCTISIVSSDCDIQDWTSIGFADVEVTSIEQRLLRSWYFSLSATYAIKKIIGWQERNSRERPCPILFDRNSLSGSYGTPVGKLITRNWT